MSLAGLGTHRLTWRRLLVLVRHLDVQGAMGRSVHGDAVLWGHSEHLLAAQLYTLQQANWQRQQGKGRRPSPPEVPGTHRRHRTSLTPAQMAARLKHQKKGGARGD